MWKLLIIHYLQVYNTFLDNMSWILAKNSSNDIAFDGSDSNMPANTGVKRSLSPLKIKASEIMHVYYK